MQAKIRSFTAVLQAIERKRSLPMEHDAAARKRELREQFRERLAGVQPLWDKAAENLRKLAVYRSATRVLVSLHPSLRQVRLNALFDRKLLLLPTPGLQHGFRLLDGAEIPIAKRAMAVSSRFVDRFGQRLSCRESRPKPIDLVISEVLAVAEDGTCLGDGAGHLDLQVAVLDALGWLAADFQVVVLVDPSQLASTLPVEPHDVAAHWLVSAREILRGSRNAVVSHPIWWDQLDRRTIRRNQALFVLSGK